VNEEKPITLPVTAAARKSLISSRVNPHLIIQAGPAGSFAWDEFFSATIRNRHTRLAYERAVRRFLDFLPVDITSLTQITPGIVGTYLSGIEGSIPTRKLHLAALRAFFDCLVNRHIVILNPAASVRGERYQAVEGLTPEVTVEQARQLLNSIPIDTPIGLRDKSLIAVLVYTAARAGAVAGLRRKHLDHDGTQYTLQFAEKGGKRRDIPLRHDLEILLLQYLNAGGIDNAPGDSPLFRSAPRKSLTLTDRPLSGVDICRMVKRRLRDAGLSHKLSPHSFRVCTVTDLLSQGVHLEEVQYLAGHADPRTTRLYDRRKKRVTRNVVERISV
jgi:integrase/recombinase XerD